jgi:competence protein ComEC
LVATFLSVGPGSATVIELPSGETILFDCGARGSSDVGRTQVLPFLRHRGIRRIDRVYVSHPNLDHFGGLITLMDEMDVGPVFLNTHFERGCGERSSGRHFLDLLAQRNHPIEFLPDTETQWTYGGATFEYLWPTGPIDDTLETNDTSTVLRISYEGHSLLFTGDIEDRAHRSLAYRGNMQADVLALPHHGSVRPSSPRFLESVSPKYVVRSSHKSMRQSASLLDMLQGVPVFNTADSGAIEVVLEREGIRVSPFRRTTPR